MSDDIKRYYINASYFEKDEVKALGAKFDGERKQWFFTNKEDTPKFRKWLSPILSGIVCKNVVFDFGEKAAPFYKTAMKYAERIIREDYLENQEMEEADVADGLMDESDREYTAPYSYELCRAEIEDLAYRLMLKAADLPEKPVIIFKDGFVTTADVTDEMVVKSLESKYKYPVKSVGSIASATTEEILTQMTCEGAAKIAEGSTVDMMEHLIDLMRNTGYSYKNCTIILNQNPNATFLRGMGWWDKNLCLKRAIQNIQQQTGTTLTPSVTQGSGVGIWCPNFEYVDNDEKFERFVEKNADVYYSKEEIEDLRDEYKKTGRIRVIRDFSIGTVWDIKDTLGIDYNVAQRFGINLSYGTGENSRGGNPRDAKRTAKIIQEIQYLREHPDNDMGVTFEELTSGFKTQENSGFKELICECFISYCSGTRFEEKYDVNIDIKIRSMNIPDDEKAVIRAAYSLAAGICSTDPTFIRGVKEIEISTPECVQLEALCAVNQMCVLMELPCIQSILKEQILCTIGEKSALQTAIDENDVSYFENNALKGLSRMDILERSFERGDALANQIVSPLIKQVKMELEKTNSNQKQQNYYKN